MKTKSKLRRLLRPASALALVLTLSACGGMRTLGDKPAALNATYEDALVMSESDWGQVLTVADSRAAKMWRLEEEKFVRGDEVSFSVGSMDVMMYFNRMTRTGHFTFNNVPGLNGENTTLTLVAYVDERGLIVKDQKTGKMQLIASDIGRSPNVGRLIISMVGNIVSAALNGVGAVIANKAIDCGDNCGGSGTAIFNSVGASAGAISESISEQQLNSTTTIGGGFKGK